MGKKGWSVNLGCLILCFCAVLIGVAGAAHAEDTQKEYTIGLAVLKDNPDYYEARTAFMNTLEGQNDITINFKLFDACGNEETYQKGLEQMVNDDKVDLIFTTGTRSTQPAVAVTKTVPIVFTAVADPVGGGIVSNMEKPGGNVTGTHCGIPQIAHVKTIKKMMPAARTIGLIYTEGEPNAELQMKEFVAAAKEEGFHVVTETLPVDCKNEAVVEEATKRLIAQNVDVIAGLQDTSISRYGAGLIRAATEAQVPTYMALSHLISQGATFSLGANFNRLGALSGEQALKILRDHVPPGDIPVGTDSNYSLIINLSAAKKVDLSIPVQLMKSASKLVT